MSATGARALIVEDDRSWQQILSEIMTDVGLTVEVAGSLDSAMDSLRAGSHRLAIIDLSLTRSDHRNRDGLRVLDAIRQSDPECVTILLTGYATVEIAVDALRARGAFTCLRKERFRRSEFRDVLRQALAVAPQSRELVGQQSGASVLDYETPQGAQKGSGRDLGRAVALVVEDDVGWRGILSELLTDAGFRVLSCASYGEALGCMRRERISVAVVDLSLVDSGGQEVWLTGGPRASDSLDGYRLLSSTRSARIPTIVVSGVANLQEIDQTYAEYRIFAFVEKQAFSRSTFLQTVLDAHAASSPSGQLSDLTEREHQVLELVARGLTNKEMAVKLYISSNTVKRHLKEIFRKLDVHTRSAAAARAVSAGMSAE